MFQYACDVKAEVVGKPSKMFFETALKDMGITADEVNIKRNHIKVFLCCYSQI